MLRIIAGKYRSRKIEQPSKTTTRPTTDRAREGLFSSIQFQIENRTFLDLFAGSGAFCLEALSRGAKQGICVEKDKFAYEVILKNKRTLNETNLDVYWMDCFTFLQKNLDKKFDYIYLDPPYKLREELFQVLDIITQADMINENGYLLIETDIDNLDYCLNNYKIIKNKKYGKIYIYYLQKTL
ncbi:DNA methylase [Metamycoplasma cloacale]|uniref:16S rRNA (Guanine(966)-N(2))-methyltransferase RsmD n=1 Tax=Metamycoplasma cloacale TaxID=92401 RepID=A0A2Z4LLK2_9BACT|nr:16S rRNA (guanine(966)-N(2))-methyltransferase RsmD [Metamycoplasma cloacale]AWX42603.1 16S rRNA (guanine(966)-N(2))-methyltransferase RsmD [Metamycoplasma cloacale]VEU79658.1 DNA methylase [Metamycoplasma cloacale]